MTAFQDEMERRRTEAMRRRLINQGLWPGQLSIPDRTPAPQNAPQAPAGQQAQQPPPEVHFHVPRPSQDDRSPLERMGDNVEEAMRDENDSRVSQMREAKRMQHAKELEAMRQEGLLKRLQAMNDSSYEQPAPAPGGPVGVFDPEAGQFRYYNGVRFG